MVATLSSHHFITSPKGMCLAYLPCDAVGPQLDHVLARGVVHGVAAAVLGVDDARDEPLAEAALEGRADAQRRHEAAIRHQLLLWCIRHSIQSVSESVSQ